MAEREIKRNGRGQIVSYEIYGAFDSKVDSDSYGTYLFKSDGDNFSRARKYENVSYNDGRYSFYDVVDNTISNELINEVVQPSPNVNLNTFITDDSIVTNQGDDNDRDGPNGTSG